MKPLYEEYDSKEADYFLRESISNLKGKIDYLYFGGLDSESEEGMFDFFKKLKISTDSLYSLLNENIIGKANKIKELHNIVKSDLELAKKVQEKIMPVQKEIDGLQIRVKFTPMAEVGGDIYDIFEISPGYVRLFLADATGHGVQAALVTMIIKSEYEMLKMNPVLPSELLTALSNKYYRLYNNLVLFFTCIVVDIDLVNKKLIYSSAGHPVQYLIPANGKIMPLGHTGKIIGIFKNNSFNDVEMDIDSNFKLLLFSDGLYEEFNESTEEYGEERVVAMFERYSKSPLDGLISAVCSDLYEFIGDEGLNDDLTIIGISIT